MNSNTFSIPFIVNRNLFSNFFETKMSLKFVFVVAMTLLLTTISLAWDETDNGEQRRNVHRTLRMEKPLDLSANEQILKVSSRN